MSRPLLVVLPFASIPVEALETMAAEVVLPEDRRKKGKSEERWQAYCAGRSALAVAFRERKLGRLKVSPDPDFGFLSVKDRPDLFVNISHTEKIAVGVLSQRPIGVDVENVNRSVEIALKRAAAPAEAVYRSGRALNVEGGEVPDAVALWSAKEAFSKALGLGIKFGLHDLRVELTGKMPFVGKTPLRGPLTVGDPAVHILRFSDYVISVCGEALDLRDGVELRVCHDLPL